ncbi:MAG: NAD(P)H-dependent oxidoreductase [Bdellovibrionales bacterium]|nr:NAD(P)H-dependent oxidoreductase [Bdellovibrionales bacterium]
MKILTIDVSPNGDKSASRTVAAKLLEKIKTTSSKVTSRDLNKNPIPHLNGATVGAFFTPAEARSLEQNELTALSDQLIDELMESEVVIISTPMWNFGPPSVLKAWIDHITRVGKTFSYGAEGLKGLAGNRKIYVVISSGSIFSSGDYSTFDALIPALKSAFGFIGIQNVHFIRVEGTNDPKHKETAVTKAIEHINQIKV